MIEETLLKSNYIGKDGFIWWLGQVEEEKYWNIDEKVSIDYIKNPSAWAYRCKVRIIGYHTFDRTILKPEDLPWAHIMLGATDGNTQGGLGKTHKFVGGETVFGFFLDGDDAQQPVVIGALHRNANTPSFDIDEIAFKPFKGPYSPGSTKRAAQSVQQNPPTSTSGPIIGGQVLQPTSATGIGTTATSKDRLVVCDQALAAAYAKLNSKEIISENGCDDNVIGKITRAIQNFIGIVSSLESHLGTYIDPVLNEFVDITQQIQRTASIITGAIKFLINNMRNIIMKMIGRLFTKFVGLVVPIPQQPITAEASKNIINIIFCLFEKIIDRLLPFLLDMLQGLVGRAINAPLCAIEEFTAAILNKVIDVIDDLLAPVLSGLNWLLGGVSQVKSILSRAKSIAYEVFNLIGCDNLKCEAPSKWSLAIGPTQAQKDNWKKTVGKMNVLRGLNNDIDKTINDLSIYGFSGSPAFRDCYDRVVNPQSQSDLVYTTNRFYTCIPPEIEIYGDGIGAQAIAVVGDGGSIISIEMLNYGIGYTYEPTISIIDKTNYGSGARARAVIRDGSVESIYLTSSGSGYCETDLNNLIRKPYYIVTSNKYSISEGESCVFTILGDGATDGTQLTYTIGGDVDDDDIDGPMTGTITIFNQSATIEIKTVKDLNVEIVEQLIFELYDREDANVARAVVLINDNNIAEQTEREEIILPPSPELSPTTGPNTGVLKNVIVENPGIRYGPEDRIRVGRCVVYPILSPNGSIVGVSSIFCPDEYNNLPTAIIDSNTGEGATLYPVLKFVPKTNKYSTINELGVIKVVDCV